MTLALETLLPEDTSQYYYYQVSVGFFYIGIHSYFPLNFATSIN